MGKKIKITDKKKLIMVVEDDRIVALDIIEKVKNLGYKVTDPAHSSIEAIKKAIDLKPDIILMDIKLDSEIDGIEAGKIIREKHDVPIVFISAYGDKKTLKRSEKASPYGYLVKPINQQSLAATIKTALFRYQTEEKIKHISSILDSIHHIGQLIAKENNKTQLLNGCCRYLVDIRGYNYVSILLIDKKRAPAFFTSAGMTNENEIIKKLINQQKYPSCFWQVINNNKTIFLINKLSLKCGNCPLKNHYEGLLSISIRLQYKENIYGVLKISTYMQTRLEAQERKLIKEIAQNISQALHNINLDEKQQASERKYKQLIEALTEGIWVVDKNMVTTYVNSRLCQMLKYSATEMKGKQVVDFLENDSVTLYQYYLDKLVKGQRVQQNFRILTKDGKIIYTMFNSSPRYNKDGNFIGFITSVLDITEKKLLENKILKISSLEQQRIGKTLHDSLGQLLTGIAFKNKLLEKKIKKKNIEECKELEQITSLISQAIEQTQFIARGLLDFDLNTYGLLQCLKELIKKVENLFGLHIKFEGDDIDFIDTQIAIQLYRIVQEAVNNAIKHGEAKKIYISLKKKLKSIILQIADDGKGDIKEMNRNIGLGLDIMHYRAESIGAILKLLPNKPSGIIVKCILYRN